MQADASGRLSTFGHIRQIMQSQGVSGFWTGATSTVARAVVLGSVKMATYDEAKGAISKALGCKPTDTKVVFIGSIVSSYCLTLACSPIDLVRTRIFTATSGGPKMTMLSTFEQVIKNEGPLALYKGKPKTFCMQIK
jgi:hypothetical protein